MTSVLLVDDEPLARALLRNLLSAYPEYQVVGEAGDGFEAMKAIQSLQPDLLFLDVQMPKVTGLELLELLDEPPAVIFTTAFDQYAMQAFDAHAVDYLLKPVTRERFSQAVERHSRLTVQQRTAPVKAVLQEQPPEGYEHRIVVKDGAEIRIIPTAEIHYLEAADDYIKIHTASGKWLKKLPLSRLETALDPNHFVRVHRSYMMPVSQLQKIEPYEKDGHLARLACGAKIPVSKTGLTRLRAILGW